MLYLQFGSCPSHHSPSQETIAIFDPRASLVEAHQGHVVVYVSTHVFEFPVNTIIAWIINDYHEQGNITISTLLLPLGHISFSSRLCFFSRNLLARFEVLCVRLSIMNMKLFDAYCIINTRILAVTLECLGDIRVG